MERSGYPALRTVRSTLLARKGVTTGAEEVAGAPEEAVVPATITAQEELQFSQAEALQKEEIEATGVTTPQKVATHTSWDGKSAEIWYYPDAKLYGVVVPFNQVLSTGPKYTALADAAAYARGAVGEH